MEKFGNPLLTPLSVTETFPTLSMDEIDLASTSAESKSLAQSEADSNELKRPCGASFAFGGKLIQSREEKLDQQQYTSLSGRSTPTRQIVQISQVTPDPKVVERSTTLNSALCLGTLENYCLEKVLLAEGEDTEESSVWCFLQASFKEAVPKQAYLELLGFSNERIQEITNSISIDYKDVNLLSEESNNDAGLTNGFLPSNISLIKGKSNSSSNTAAAADNPIVERKLNQALLIGNIELAIKICIKHNQWTEAILLASKSERPDLFQVVTNKYLNSHETKTTSMLRAVVAKDMNQLIETSDLDNWQETLATVLLHQIDVTHYAQKLGQRLLSQSNDQLQRLQSALICYICSGNLSLPSIQKDLDSTFTLMSKVIPESDYMDLMEQVVVVYKLSEMRCINYSAADEHVFGTSILVDYCNLLVSQGCLQIALNFLGNSNISSAVELKQRINQSLGCQTQSRHCSGGSGSRRSSGIAGLRRYPSGSGSQYQYGSTPPATSFQPFHDLSGPPAPPTTYQTVGPTASGDYYNVGAHQPLARRSSGGTGYTPSNMIPITPVVPSYYNPAETVGIQRPSFVPTTPGVSSVHSSPSSSTVPTLINQMQTNARAWNDPPVLSSLPKSKPTSVPVQTVEPITHPIFGSGPVPNNPAPPSFGTNANIATSPVYSQPFTGNGGISAFYNPPQTTPMSNYSMPPQPSMNYGMPQQQQHQPPPPSMNYGMPQHQQHQPPPMSGGFIPQQQQPLSSMRPGVPPPQAYVPPQQIQATRPPPPPTGGFVPLQNVTRPSPTSSGFSAMSAMNNNPNIF